MLRGFGIAGLALAASIIAAAAQEMKSPRVSSTQVDWDAAVLELAPIDTLRQADALEVMAEFNRATGERFADIAVSPVPVLLPFDAAAFLRHRATAADPAGPATAIPTAPGDYLSGFSAVPFFYPGPAGYDAVVMARAQEMPELAIGYSEPIYIHIGGSALVYELDEPVGMIGWPVHGLEGIPGIRRLYLENFVRYTFVRYGVPYVVAIECSDSGLRIRKMSCRDADKVAVRFLKALRLAGGTPQKRPDAIDAGTIDRPPQQSAEFTYHSPGDIIPGTGFRRKGGVADYTVYSRLRFPIARAPAFANSQSFMNWGNCEATGRTGAGKLDGVSAYRCRVSGQTLISDESARANYSYPWSKPLRALPARRRGGARRGGAAGAAPGGALHRGQCAQRAHPGPLLAHAAQAIRRRWDDERPPRARRRGDRQGRQLLQARARHHLSPAFRPAGPDQIRLGIRQSLHDLGGVLRAADPRPRPGNQGPGHQGGRAHGVDPAAAGSSGPLRAGGGHGRKADRNNGRIARARDNRTGDSAR
jgi:hypothetical protein